MRDRNERIEDDLTWRERQMMWNLGLIARKEKRQKNVDKIWSNKD